MNIGDLRAYAKVCHDGWQDLVCHEEASMDWYVLQLVEMF